jgi:hypothetical protein
MILIDNDFINGNIFTIFDEVMGHKEQPAVPAASNGDGQVKVNFRPSQ